ncbi:MAG: hypothetical protein SGI71_08240, partial [Verrucomicrobiota bacterium]|nr:hypothetical protein [Verrucomicrobiota bacterium]
KNPKGIPSNSPGLLVLEKPWVKPGSRTTPKGLRQKIAPAINLIEITRSARNLISYVLFDGLN